MVVNVLEGTYTFGSTKSWCSNYDYIKANTTIVCGMDIFLPKDSCSIAE